MGKNNRDYKIKDKNLTKNKKNAKLNKSIAFTLAGMAAIGAGATLGGQNQDAQAMMGRVGSMASKMVKTTTTTKMPMSNTKVTSSIGTKVGTSRVLNGAPGAINSGKLGSNGLSYAGLPKTSTTTSTLNKTTTTTTSTPKTQTATLTTTTTKTTTSSSTSSTKGTPKLSNVGSLGSKTDPFKGGSASSVTLKNGDLNQKAYNQQKNTGGPTFTTEGFYRK